MIRLLDFLANLRLHLGFGPTWTGDWTAATGDRVVALPPKPSAPVAYGLRVDYPDDESEAV